MLGLTVIVMTMVSALMQIYMNRLDESQEQIRQMRLSHAVLNGIADDIKNVIRYNDFADTSALQEIIAAAGQPRLGANTGATTGTSTGGAATGGGGTGGGGTTGGTSGGGTTGGTSGGGTTGGTSGAPSGGSGGGTGTQVGSGTTTVTTDTSTTTDPAAATTDTSVVVITPGLYGDDTYLQLDISRPPRPDQYYPQLPDLTSGAVADVTSDMKTVTFMIQPPGSQGVQDIMSQSSREIAAGGGGMSKGGLIRRSLDRGITQYLESQGQTQQLTSTGEMLAPEVVAMGFAYYDGFEWLTSWDSSIQGLPWMVQITIAIQDSRAVKDNPLSPGVAISTLTPSMISDYKLSMYNLSVAIPGAQLLTAPSSTPTSGTSTDTGASSVGL